MHPTMLDRRDSDVKIQLNSNIQYNVHSFFSLTIAFECLLCTRYCVRHVEHMGE